MQIVARREWMQGLDMRGLAQVFLWDWGHSYGYARIVKRFVVAWGRIDLDHLSRKRLDEHILRKRSASISRTMLLWEGLLSARFQRPFVRGQDKQIEKAEIAFPGRARI